MKKKWIWITGGSLLLLGLTGWIAVMAFLGRLPWQKGNAYSDPQGRYTLELDPDWEEVSTDGTYTQFWLPDPPLAMYIKVFEDMELENAYEEMFLQLGFDPSIIAGGARASFGDWQAVTTEDDRELSYGIAGQAYEGDAFVMVVHSEQPGVSPENASVIQTLMSIEITGKEALAFDSYEDVEIFANGQIDNLAGSVSMAVIRGGEVVYTYAYGDANPVEGLAADMETIYPWGSMTKLATATGVMQLVERGQVDLDVWAGEYIPELPESWDVTARQMLSHSACMPSSLLLAYGWTMLGNEPFPLLEEVSHRLLTDYPDLICEPGNASQYSNTHYLYLGRIIEEVSGMDFQGYIKANVIDPLGMQTISFEFIEDTSAYAKPMFQTATLQPVIDDLNEFKGPGQETYILYAGEQYTTLADYRVLPPWGGLKSTPADVTDFLRIHLANGTVNGQQILQPETVAAMQEMQLANDGSELGFGLGWWVGEDDFGTYYHHAGGVVGGECLTQIYPEYDLGIVVMGNVNGYNPDKIVTALASVELGY